MIRFVDSFDHYDTAKIPNKYTTLNGSVAIAAGEGRSGTAALRINNTNQAVSITLGPSAEWHDHFSFRATTGGIIIADNIIWRFSDGVPGGVQIYLYLRNDFLIGVYRGNTHPTNPTGIPGQLIGVTSAPALTMADLWHIQVSVVHHATNGSIVIAVNEQEVFNVSGIRTINVNTAAQPYSTSHGIGPASFNVGIGAVYYDDIVICDGAGGVNDSALGDVRVTAVLPDADGDDLDYAASGAGDHYEQVDENPSNADTDYESSNTIGAQALYHYSDIDALGDVLGVQTVATDRKTAGGTRLIKHRIKFGVGPTILAGQEYGPTTGYIMNRNVFDTDLEGDIEMQAGPEITA